jgi:predicted amidohydrolase YtcJ
MRTLSGPVRKLTVMDRDYLTIPADQIKDIKAVMTMVGGKTVYDAGTEASSLTTR